MAKGNGKPKSPWVEAEVKSFNPRKGWGFLKSPDAPRDIFVHKGVSKQGISMPLESGQQVMARYRDGEGGMLQATHLKLVSA